MTTAFAPPSPGDAIDGDRVLRGLADDIRSARADVPAPDEPDLNRIHSMLRLTGRNPDRYSAPRDLAEFPKVNYPEALGTGYSDFATRVLYDRMDDAEKIRTAALVSGKASPEVERVTRELLETRTRRDLDAIAFPEDDAEAIAKGLVPGPVAVGVDYVEELQKTPEGKDRLRQLWTDAQTNRRIGANSLEYLMYQAQAIGTDDAVLLADFRRLAEDSYGGTARAVLNLGKDFGSGAVRMVNQGGWWTANTALRLLSNLGPTDEMIRGRHAFGPLTESETADLRAALAADPPIQEAIDYTEASAELGKAFYHRPQARTGSFLYDKLASPVAGGLGTVLSSITTFMVNPALGWATMYGSAKGEIYDRAVAEGMDAGTAHLVSDIGAVFSAGLERLGAEKVVNAWRPLSPGAKALRQSVVAPFVGEGLTEAAQSFVGSAAVEAGQIMQPGYEFDLADFLGRAVPEAMEEGIYGAITGVVAGGAGSRPLRVAVQDIQWRTAQRFLSGGVDRLTRTKAAKSAPEKLWRVADDIVEKSGAPATMYMDADAVQILFQADKSKLEAALGDMDVTRQAFDHALDAGAKIEVSTSGLMRHLARNPQEADLQRLAQVTPDAPTMGVIIQQEADKAALAEEFNRIRRENQSLPEPFAVFRRQLVESGHAAAEAQHATDMLYAMSRVAGQRLGLTPEQFLDLNPVQVILANGLKRAHSYNEIVRQREMRRNREAAAEAEVETTTPAKREAPTVAPGVVPAEGADIAQWNKETIATLMEQAGVSPEQANDFTRYVESLIEQGNTLPDARTIAAELETATYAAEGLEQAAAGLDRILTAPDQITQATFDAMDIDAATVQEGMAAIRDRADTLKSRAQSFRTFYRSPAMVEQVRRQVQLAQGERGNVTLTPDVNVIRLFNGRQDRSTVMHELFHIYFRHLETAAKSAPVGSQVAADYIRLNNEVGRGLDSPDPDARRTAEERVATMFEKYLSEGVAPAPSLGEAFRRFRTWLTGIYRQVREFSDINLSDDVRGVFDRMIAGEAEIAYARDYYNDFENLTAPAAAPAEVKASLEEKATRARRTAEELQISRVVREYMKAVGGRSAFRKRARDELAAQRPYRVVGALKEWGGISRESAVREVGEAEAARIERDHKGVIARRGDGNADAVMIAERFGYASVRNMLSDLAAADNFGRAVNRMTDRLVEAEETEIRRVASEDAATPADEAYHNDSYSEYFAAKQRALDALATEQAARESRRADRMLSDRAIRDSAEYNNSQKSGIKAGQYHIEVAAFKRHSENAMRAEKAGDNIGAAKEWRLMRMAHYGIKAAIQARQDLERFQDRHTRVNAVVARLEGRNHRKSAPVEFLFREAIKDILTTFKVTVARRLRPEGPVGESIAIPGHQLTPEAESMLPPLAMAIAPWIVNRTGAADIRSWRDLRMEQIRELDQALRSLENLGRGTLQALKQPGIESREQLKRESIARMLSREERPKIHNPKKFGGKLLNSLEALGVKAYIPEYILAMADGNTNITGKGIGPLQNMAHALRRGLARKSDMVAGTMARINPALRTLQNYRRRFRDIDKSTLGPLPAGLESAYGYTEWDAEMGVMLALNSGNAGNLKALLEGYGISEEQWRGIASTFTAAEWDAVQAIWDAIGDYFPDIDAVTFRLVNRHVHRVEAQPFIVTTHIDKVAHYVALAEAVHEADLLTIDQDWANVFTSRFGQRHYDAIRGYIKHVADPDAGNLGGNDWGRQALEWMRHKATVAALGFRFWTGMKQRLDYFPAALHMSLHSRTGASGFKYLIRGMRDIGWRGNLGLMNAKIKEIYGKSEFMRDRDGNVTADMREIIARTTGEQKVYDVLGFEFSNTDIYNAAFKFMSTQDRAASSAVWLGAYQMALDGNGSFNPEGLTPEQLERAAIPSWQLPAILDALDAGRASI